MSMLWVPSEPAPYTAANRRHAEQAVRKQREEKERQQKLLDSAETTVETDKADVKQIQSDIYVSSLSGDFWPRLDSNS